MSALTSLTDEHQLIGELLGALQTYATRLRSAASVDPADLARFAELFRELVDYRHHEKEEGILFPFLARNGFDWSTGLLAELHREHGHLRYLIDVLCQAAARDLPASREQRRTIAETAMAFVDAKRQHMQREESALLTAITRRLSLRALDQLAAELAQFDEATGRAFSSASVGAASLAQQAAGLVQRYREDSASVDVTGVHWVGAESVEGRSVEGKPVAGKPAEAVSEPVFRDAAGASFISYGRSR